MGPLDVARRKLFVARSPLRAALALAPALALTSSCNEAPPPLPAALIVVDTDVDAPRTVSRLRIDIFGEDGTWLHSRDVPRIHAGDWPTSFGVLAPDESRETTVLVRLRAYPEGATRDYRGTRHEARPTFAPPHVPKSLQEVCDNLQDLPPFVEMTARRGPGALTADSCLGFKHLQSPHGVGPVAARVNIPTKGRYRFEVIRSIPTQLTLTDTTLFLRTSCMDERSEIVCEDNIDEDNNWLSRIVTDLDPGTYTLMTGGADGQSADLTLRWAPEAEWGPEAPSVPTTEVPILASQPPYPRQKSGGDDVTPPVEPLPTTTIDRVVRVKLTPGQTGEVRVTLRGACAGTVSDLPAAGETRIDPASVRTCVDDPAALAPPPVEALLATLPPEPPKAGTMFPDEGCAPEDSDDQVVCVPAGTFIFGGRELDGLDAAGAPSALPMRLAAMHRFWMDRREVTVGRYREAVKAGFTTDQGREPAVNDGPIKLDSFWTKATYTSSAGARESFPVVSLSWGRARAFCQYYGGDLPTEAQWEYAASAAGRAHKATFPWGEDAPTCDRAVVNRVLLGTYSCPGAYGARPVDSPELADDVNALGIEGLAGNVSEFVRDESQRLDAPCWMAQGPIDPTCDDTKTGLFRIVRGSSWMKFLALTRSVARVEMPSLSRISDAGARCAYAEPPARRWSAK